MGEIFQDFFKLAWKKLETKYLYHVSRFLTIPVLYIVSECNTVFLVTYANLPVRTTNSKQNFAANFVQYNIL